MAKRSEQFKKKMSEARTGPGNPNWGKKWTEDRRKKVSKALLGDKNPMWGKKPSQETRLLQSKRNKGVKKSKEWIIQRKERIGDKSPNWKGGSTSSANLIRHSVEYKLWRESVFKRDKFKCIFCGCNSNRLQADHIKPFSLYPELRFAIDNGRTLCESCHKNTDTWGGRAVRHKHDII